MKVCDFIFPFSVVGPHATRGICRVRLFISPSRTVIAVLTDLGDKNPGDSVTNRVEAIRAQLIQRGYMTADAIIVEHYETSMARLATFDHVAFSAEGRPKWRKMTIEETQSLIGASSDELNSSASEDCRLLAEMDQMRHALAPALDNPALESKSVITRKLEIERGMVPRASIKARIDAGDGETALQQLLKSDLSILGEMHGFPADEYVCFAEFPIANGFVDFVVLSGRSRMDVVLVEIKGADFPLLNSDSYAGFSRKINQAADQIRQRFGHIYRHYEQFRIDIHRARQDVESGRSSYQSFRGPQDRLQVDPDKDINVRAVVVGGRTRDDRRESSKRHDYETRFVPSIRIESWDTWLRKLRRW